MEFSELYHSPTPSLYHFLARRLQSRIYTPSNRPSLLMSNPLLTSRNRILPALITPLTAEGELDVVSLEHLIDHLYSSGVGGLGQPVIRSGASM